jgi:hypothetical protein
MTLQICGRAFEHRRERPQRVRPRRCLTSSPTAVTIDAAGSEATRTPGPFVDATAYVGGFSIIDVSDQASALTWAEQCSAAVHSRTEVGALHEERHKLLTAGRPRPRAEAASGLRRSAGCADTRVSLNNKASINSQLRAPIRRLD